MHYPKTNENPNNTLIDPIKTIETIKTIKTNSSLNIKEIDNDNKNLLFNIPTDISVVLRMSKERKHKLKGSNNFMNELSISNSIDNNFKESFSDQVMFSNNLSDIIDNKDKK